MPRRSDRLTLSLAPADPPAESFSPVRARPWISMHWRCCSVYSRIYRHPEADRYRGTCPKCGMPATLRVGAGGTAARAFETG